MADASTLSITASGQCSHQSLFFTTSETKYAWTICSLRMGFQILNACSADLTWDRASVLVQNVVLS